MKTAFFLGVVGILGACAARPGAKVEDDLATKNEALVGRACSDDAGCSAWEFCDRLLCIPERPCPASGVCRDTTSFFDTTGAAIPDSDSRGVTRTLTVRRPEVTVASVAVNVSIAHTYRGDLQVVLQAPSGTEVVLHDRTGGGEDNLEISREVPELAGEAALGDWRLVVRDLAARDTGRISSFNLSFVFSAAPPAPSGSWSSVTLSGAESAHPYANRFTQTWDLRPWTGGGTRARIHFTRIDTEARYDFVEIVDANTSRVLDSFSGRYENLTTREYDTAALQILLRTDGSVTRWGFQADRVDVWGAGCLSDAECGPGESCDPITCIRYPCFSHCSPRGGTEGSACRASSDCSGDLYCAADGTCRRDSTCAVTDDCTAEGNEYIRILCAGFPTCRPEGTCAWQCGAHPVCVDGETRDDGCNTCVCSAGSWACTKRGCPAVANEGEACGAGTACAEGLVCDRGATDGAVCGGDRPGVCLTPDPVYCRALYAPVCTCNGQTFPNDCGRARLGEWAHAGRCELSLAIPDANTTGVTTSIYVGAPSGATRADVSVEIDHSWRGDLVVTVIAPNGARHVLSNRAGGDADDFDYTGSIELDGFSGLGTWTLEVSDRATADVGVIRFFNVIAAR